MTSTAALPARQLACLLYDAASGISADVAAVMLIDRHGHFLHDPAFRRIIAAGSSITTGENPSRSSGGKPPSMLPAAAACPARHQSRPSCGSPPASATTASPSGSVTCWAAWTPATSPWSPAPSPPPTAEPARPAGQEGQDR